MQQYDSLHQVFLEGPSTLTIGVFDGLHIGHQKLIRQLVAQAQAAQQLAVVMSFYPHPDVVLRGITGRYYLTPIPEKHRLLAEMGVDVLILHPFDEELRHVRAAAFIDLLREHVNLKTLWATSDFALGHQREGNLAFLQAQGAEKGFALQTVDLLSNGEPVSSTRIREALAAGEIKAANQLLGRPYRISGEVVHGDARGRSIGFPTANTYVWEGQILPANGVYVCRAYLGNEGFGAVTNVGNRPTFDGQSVTVEAHIFDFDRDIYGQTLSLEFLERLRGEQKFSRLEDLVQQIGADAQAARAILAADHS